MKLTIEISAELKDGIDLGYKNTVSLFDIEKIMEAIKNGEEAKDADENEDYKKGLDDAWECAKKIVSSDYRREMNDIFDDDYYYDRYGLFTKYSAAEVIAKIMTYEAEQEAKKKQEAEANAIEVGDEVYIPDFRMNAIVTSISEVCGVPSIQGITFDGRTHDLPVRNIQKTGKHFDKIVEMIQYLKAKNREEACEQ